MQARYLFAIFIGAALAGWIISGRISPEPQANTPLIAVQMQPEIDSAAHDEAPLMSDVITLSRQSDGHFYTNAAVETGGNAAGEGGEQGSEEGGEIRFLVDTGASAIALTGSDAEALGIEWDEGELQLVGRGVSGDVFGKPIMLKSVQVGDIVAYNVQAAIIPSGLDVSLLGQSFLTKVGNVNIQGNQMTFE